MIAEHTINAYCSICNKDCHICGTCKIEKQNQGSYRRNYGSYRKSSAHYFADDNSVTISVPDTYTAWSVGGNRYANYKITGGATLYKKATNNNTINIELCDTVRNGKYDVSARTLENAAQLTKNLIKKYNIPITNVIRHFDVTGKNCPAYYVSQYPDLREAFGTNYTDLFHHFCSNGMKEGRAASADFNVNAYKNHYADLRHAFGNNLPLYYKHYITNGYKEKRKCL